MNGRREDVVEARARGFDDVSKVFQGLPSLEPDVPLDDFAIRAQGSLPRDEDEIPELHAPGERESDRGKVGLDRFFVHGPPVPPSPVMRVDNPDLVGGVGWRARRERLFTTLVPIALCGLTPPPQGPTCPPPP